MTTSETRGQGAERLVAARIRSVVGDEVAVLANVRWILRDHGYDREGEADIVIADPQRGILVIEVKSGQVRRDDEGTWWAGERLKRSPFKQAADSCHALIRKLKELQDWPAGLDPIAGHAVALPDVELDRLGGRLGLLGPDVDPELIADQSTCLDTDAGHAEMRTFLDRAFEVWGGGSRKVPGHAAIVLLQATLTTPIELRGMLRNEIAGAEPEVVRLTRAQFNVLDSLRSMRRAAIIGGAGTGKTMLAAEKARRLVREGYRTLLVCYNSPLVQMLANDLAEESKWALAHGACLDVTTFHQLCEDLGVEAGVLGPRPSPTPPEWWDVTLPDALDRAVERLGPRYDAIVVDEGQDFAEGWLLSLETLLQDGHHGVLYVFHDPGQAIYRPDAIDQLRLPEIHVQMNCRNAQPIHDVVRRLAGNELDAAALREDGRPPECIEVDGDHASIEALRKVLHRLRVDEGVRPSDMAVLTGTRLEASAVWHVPGRRFGNEVLGNPAIDDAGRNLGLPARDVPHLPDDVILCDTIRRFKGLERPVIILMELEAELADPEKLRQSLYVGASRARQHLVVIGSSAVLAVLRGAGS